jgi:hypothetical protein
MIYVDAAVWKKSPKGRKFYAHMVADSMGELHEFACKIGVKPHFFHRSKTAPHYDITSDQHLVAIANGAQLVDSREVLAKGKLLLPSQLGPLSDAISEFASQHRK